MTPQQPATSRNIPQPPKPKTTGDYLDVEGRPFVIKKILTGGRIMIKEMPNWPVDEPDWHQVENLNRKGRMKLAQELRQEAFEKAPTKDFLEFSMELVQDVLIPLLEGKALEMSENQEQAPGMKSE